MRRVVIAGVLLVLGGACSSSAREVRTTPPSAPTTSGRVVPTVEPTLAASAATTSAPAESSQANPVEVQYPAAADGAQILLSSGLDVTRLHRDGVDVVDRLGAEGERVGPAWQVGDQLVVQIEAPLADGSTLRIATLDLSSDSAPVELAEFPKPFLLEAGRIDGEPRFAFIDTSPGFEGTEEDGPLWLGFFDGSPAAESGLGWAAESTPNRFSFGPDLLGSYYSDLTETVFWRGYGGGALLERPSPTDGIDYNNPPLVIQAVQSPDGETYAYLSGPDWIGAAGEISTDPWFVVQRESLTGAVLAEVELDTPDATPFFLDFDGTTALISRSLEDESYPSQSPIFVDLASGDQQTIDNASGYATFVDP